MKHSILKRLVAFAVIVAIMCLNACDFFRPKDTEALVEATVFEVEKYGHVVLDVTVAELADCGYAFGDVISISFGAFEANLPYYDGYYCDPGEMMLRGGAPEEYVAACINYGDFATTAGVSVGDTATITLFEKAGALTIQDLCSLRYTDDRADYADDAAFANFRAVTIGRIGINKLYRTASPVDNERGRAPYANNLIAGAGVATVINLADSVEDIEEFFAEEGFDSLYYQQLYNAGAVAVMDLGNNFYTDDFAARMVDVLTFLAQNEPPYCIHCKEGKDRTGFAIMVIEALMGAELDDIIDDYMISYENYYGIIAKNEPERYQIVLDVNVVKQLCYMTGTDSYEELAQIDLEAAVTEYLINAGMTESTITTLRGKLSE